MKKVFIKITIVLQLLCGIILGQTNIQIPDTLGLIGKMITVPIRSGNLNAVGSLTLNISYDPRVIKFNAESGISNSPFKNSGTFLANNIFVNETNNIISIGWFSANTISVKDKLMDLSFEYLGGTSLMKFNGVNEITDGLAQKLNVKFIDGSISATTSADENILHQGYILSQNYPNPFNPTTVIKYEVPEQVQVSLKLHDLLGKEIFSLVNEEKQPGKYEVRFDGSNLSSGIYYYRLQAGSFVQTKKLVLMK